MAGNPYLKKKKNPVDALIEDSFSKDEYKQEENKVPEQQQQEVAATSEQIQPEQQSEDKQEQPKPKVEVSEEEIKEDLEQNKLEQNGVISLKKKNKKKTKDYKNMFLSITTITLIKKYSKELNMGESELVDTLLKDAFNRLEVK